MTLTVEECKKYLGNTKLSDKEIEALRDALCLVVDKVLDGIFNGSTMESK